ncbi:MAG: hypothetical protein U0Q16_18410 [Bryobacteraceae bacterium]
MFLQIVGEGTGRQLKSLVERVNAAGAVTAVGQAVDPDFASEGSDDARVDAAVVVDLAVDNEGRSDIASPSAIE